MLPFTREQFFTVFSDYNEAVWPAQAALYIVALVAAGISATAAVVVDEATIELALEAMDVETPLEKTVGAHITGKKLTLVPILRAWHPLHPLLDRLPFRAGSRARWWWSASI